MAIESKASPVNLRDTEHGASLLTVTQQQLWMLNREVCNPGTLNMSYAVLVDGPISPSALEGAFKQLGHRHEQLRSTYVTADGRPDMKVHDDEFTLAGVNLEPKRVSDLGEGAEFALQERERKFDLSRQPPISTSLLKLDDEQHVLLLTFHHISVDGWSLSILCRDLARFYCAQLRNDIVPPAPGASQCADHALWQKDWLAGEQAARELDWWAKTLDSMPFPGPFSAPSAQVETEISRQVLAVPKELMDRAQKFSRRTIVSLYTVLLASFKVVIAERSGCTDVVVGSLAANRPTPGSANVLGAHYNVLLLRTDLSGDPALADVIIRTAQTTVTALDHQILPYPVLAQAYGWSAKAGQTPSVMFQFDNYPLHQFKLEGTRVSGLYLEDRALPASGGLLGSIHATTTSGLTFFVRETYGNFTLTALYPAGHISDDVIAGMMQSYLEILDLMIERPETSLSELNGSSGSGISASGQCMQPRLRPIGILSPVEALSPVSTRLPENPVASGA